MSYTRYLILVILVGCLVASGFVFFPSTPAHAEDKADAAAPAETDKPEADPYAELPHWPVGLKLPDSITEGWGRAERIRKSPQADVLVWTPPGAKKLRAVFLIPANTDSKHLAEHDAVRKVCAKHEIGIVYLRHFGGEVIERSDPPTTADEKFAATLDFIAKETGIAEFRHAPWITLGKSSRGRFPFRTTWWFPDRVIASISYHGEVPTWPMEKWSKVGDESVLHLAINGLTEWDGTWYRHVRPGLLNYHHNTNWLAHQVVLYGVDHGTYVDQHGSPGWEKKVPATQISTKRVWDYAAKFIDTAMELRVPKDSYPTDKPTKLKQVDRATGYLVHPRAPEQLLGLKWFAFEQDEKGTYQVIQWPDRPTPVYDDEQGNVPFDKLIVKATDVPEDERADYLWIPNRAMVSAWLDLHDLYKTKKRVMPAEDQE